MGKEPSRRTKVEEGHQGVILQQIFVMHMCMQARIYPLPRRYAQIAAKFHILSRTSVPPLNAKPQIP